ncbi:excalibur calcium-binding domain-containing protein [Croceibacterium ferulae]|uniref:excalibur calcium-binding domain-containing protein n=1 Tax=Croceibacterium ferulae TaxID=1854641 RepID=UPI001F4DEF8C|nr:excalibur calcium-binding domain-containing protein [Croceibacterium ferulae]
MVPHKLSEPVPICRGRRYRRQTQLRQIRATTWLFVVAALIEAALGGASVVATPQSLASVEALVTPIAVFTGSIRARSPQERDYWSRCDEARVSGSAPLYDGEPGYRIELDRDRDGIACEPYAAMP